MVWRVCHANLPPSLSPSLPLFLSPSVPTSLPASVSFFLRQDVCSSGSPQYCVVEGSHFFKHVPLEYVNRRRRSESCGPCLFLARLEQRRPPSWPPTRRVMAPDAEGKAFTRACDVSAWPFHTVMQHSSARRDDERRHTHTHITHTPEHTHQKYTSSCFHQWIRTVSAEPSCTILFTTGCFCLLQQNHYYMLVYVSMHSGLCLVQ